MGLWEKLRGRSGSTTTEDDREYYSNVEQDAYNREVSRRKTAAKVASEAKVVEKEARVAEKQRISADTQLAKAQARGVARATPVGERFVKASYDFSDRVEAGITKGVGHAKIGIQAAEVGASKINKGIHAFDLPQKQIPASATIKIQKVQKVKKSKKRSATTTKTQIQKQPIKQRSFPAKKVSSPFGTQKRSFPASKKSFPTKNRPTRLI